MLCYCYCYLLFVLSNNTQYMRDKNDISYTDIDSFYITFSLLSNRPELDTILCICLSRNLNNNQPHMSGSYLLMKYRWRTKYYILGMWCWLFIRNILRNRTPHTCIIPLRSRSPWHKMYIISSFCRVNKDSYMSNTAYILVNWQMFSEGILNNRDLKTRATLLYTKYTLNKINKIGTMKDIGYIVFTI